MYICENWGIAIERAVEFFETLSDVQKLGEGEFAFGECIIRIRELPDRELGSLRFPRTELQMEGGSEDSESIHRRFMLRFLSAGG